VLLLEQLAESCAPAGHLGSVIREPELPAIQALVQSLLELSDVLPVGVIQL
jgi:hypothetical protein